MYCRAIACDYDGTAARESIVLAIRDRYFGVDSEVVTERPPDGKAAVVAA